jgi:Fur family ferric uptake transcriptional regulator
VPATDVVLDPLDRAGYRLTAPRRALAELIAERPGHFTAEELLATSRDRRLGLGRATIFRSLELLTELGVVERLDLPTGAHAFVACDRQHHHHVVCSSCGTAADVPDQGLDRLVEHIATSSGFRIDRHRLELFGLCPSCQARAGKDEGGT